MEGGGRERVHPRIPRRIGELGQADGGPGGLHPVERVESWATPVTHPGRDALEHRIAGNDPHQRSRLVVDLGPQVLGGEDEAHVLLEKVHADLLDTNFSVAAVSGMKGAIEGLNGVDKQRFSGKVIVYPQLTDMDLIELSDLPSQVADKLENGVWTKEAEKALMEL